MFTRHVLRLCVRIIEGERKEDIKKKNTTSLNVRLTYVYHSNVRTFQCFIRSHLPRLSISKRKHHLRFAWKVPLVLSCAPPDPSLTCEGSQLSPDACPKSCLCTKSLQELVWTLLAWGRTMADVAGNRIDFQTRESWSLLGFMALFWWRDIGKGKGRERRTVELQWLKLTNRNLYSNHVHCFFVCEV